MEMKTNSIEKGGRKEVIIFLIFILMLLLLGLWFIWSNSLLLWDENVFLGNARSHISLSNFIEDFRFPLLEYIIASVWFFTGESVFSARLLSVFFYILSVFTFYLIMNILFNKDKKVILFSALFAITPVMLYWSFRVYADILSMAMSLLVVYFLIMYSLSKNKYSFIVLVGFFSSMAFLARFALAILVFSVFVYLIIKKDKKAFFLFALVSLLSILPWLFYNWINYGNMFWDLLYYQQSVNMWTTREPIINEIKNIALNLGFLIIFFIPGLVCFINKMSGEIRGKKAGIYSFLSFYILLSIIYYTFFVNLKDERYVIIMLPFFFLISFFGLNYIAKKIYFSGRKIKKIGCILITFLLLFSFIFFLSIDLSKFYASSECQKENAILYSINYIKNNSLLSDGDVIISNHWPYYAYYFNVKAYAIWGSNLDEKIEEYKPKLFILKENDGTDYTTKSIESSENIISLQNFSDKCGNKIKIYAINFSTSSLS